MSGVLRLSNNVTGRSTIIASASNDQTFTLPATGGTLLAGGSSLEVIFPPGTEALPGLHVQGDIDTGLYAPAANTLAISTDGTERLRVDSAGNVGIGVTVPLVKLDVVDSAALSAIFRQSSGNQTSVYIEHDDSSGRIGTSYAAGGGAYKPLVFETSNTERMRIDSSGDVTVVGSAQPKLRVQSFGDYCEIKSDGNGSVILDADPDNSASNSLIRFLVDGGEKARIDSSGNVGIGRTSPAQNLDVASSSNIAYALDGWALAGKGDSSDILFGGILGSQFDTLKLFTSGSERLRIDSSGNVGIGTTSPREKLHVSGSGDIKIEIETSNNSNAGLEFKSSASNFIIQGGNAAGNGLRFYDIGNTTERMRIDSSGRLLVGTSSPPTDTTNGAHYCKLVSVGNTSSSTGDGRIALCRGTTASSLSSGNGIGEIHFADSAGGGFAYIAVQADGTPGANDYPGRLLFATTADGASSPTERMRISAKGRCSTVSTDGAANVIATTLSANTSNALIVGKHSSNGSVDNGSDCFVIRTNGNVENTNNSYGAISDAKLKENIVDANSQWNDLKAIKVRNYNFIEGQTHTQIGVVAQEVETVSPGLVTESPDRDAEGEDLGTVTKAVNYSVLYIKAIKALQEAMERIETLETEVASLRSK